jgi:hypothetical protein
LESTISQAIECINFASRDGKLMPNVTGMRAELTRTEHHELRAAVVQFLFGFSS